jgi:hypothetical protein
LSGRTVVAAWVAWSLPFALGPPLFSRDVYAYAAQGELARHGLDPATTGIESLRGFGAAGSVFVDAVDPRWRETHAPYGGTAVAVEKAAAAIGTALFGPGPTGAVVVLKVIAVAASIALVVTTLALARTAGVPAPWLRPAPAGRVHAAAADGGPGWPFVVALVGCNPVVVIHLVGGAHLDAVAAVLVVGALLLQRRRAEHRRVTAAGAVALACLAATVKATAGVALAWLVLAHARDAARAAPGGGTGSHVADGQRGVNWQRDWQDGQRGADGRGTADGRRAGGGGTQDDSRSGDAGRPSRRRRRSRAVTGAVVADLGVAAATALASMLASGFGPTWIGALPTSGKLETGVAPASILAAVVTTPLHFIGFEAPWVLPVTRALAFGAASAVVGVLLWRSWRDDEPLRRRDGLAVVGFGGMAVALGSPVLYPWYLAPALPALAVLLALDAAVPRRPGRASGRKRGKRGRGGRERPTWLALVAVTSVWLCLATLSPLAATWRLFGRLG